MSRPTAQHLLFTILAASFLVTRAFASDSSVIASHDDAYVSSDPSGQAWSIGSAAIELVIGFDESSRLSVRRLWNPQTGNDWDVGSDPDVTVTVSGRLLHLESSADVTFSGAAAIETDAGVQLTFTFEDRTTHVFVQHVYVCYAGTPTIETWTRIDGSRSSSVEISNLIGWQMTMPVGNVRWVNGLRGDSAGDPDDWNGDSFTICGGPLDDGQNITIGSDRRSSENYLPFVFVDGDTQTFFGGVIWSGTWQVSVSRADDRLTVAATFPGIARSVSTSQALEFPHAFFGLSGRSTSDQAAALRQFVMRGIRKGRPFQPLVTYNTWFPYGANVTEADVDEEMHRASEAGIELFVIDAGWLAGSGANGPNDFTTGLGSWQVDPDRFPAQLEGMSDQAHDLGMLLGLWVEPERVALATIDQPGLAREQWLATENGSYGSDDSAQICLASPDARAWVFDELVALIDRVHPDYLKWDNNFWINCNRPGHDHGIGDGNFAHVQALYGLLSDLRSRYPDLLIENVSGGGNRLDFGMLAYSDTAWMDDRTAPSSLVRHNLEGVTTAFPPGYLLSFVIDSANDSISGPDLSSIVRSRMPGILGLTYRSEDLSDDLKAQISAAISEYKRLRDAVSQSSAALLGSQAPLDDGWDVVQETVDDQRSSVIFAFKENDDEGRLLLRPDQLLPDVVYAVQSIDTGDLGLATGGDLMQNGIEVVHASGSRAHVLVFTAQ